MYCNSSIKEDTILRMTFSNKYKTPFESNSGSMRLINGSTIIPVIIALSLIALIIIKSEIIGMILCFSIFFIVALTYKIFNNPKTGIYVLIVLGFLVTGASRYVIAPWGLTIDILLVLIYAALFFKVECTV